MASFKEAFAAARKKLGAGKTFEWNGKSYSTNLKEEVSKPASAAPTKSIRPKAKPASNTASVSAVSGASRGATGKSATRLARLKKESAMQKDRSAVKLGMTLRERNQK
jgi:hypothetical protein